jgi:hypothetical protein
MAILALVRIADDEIESIIVAEMSDWCPEGFYFVELPPDHTWHKGRIVSQRALQTGSKDLVEF